MTRSRTTLLAALTVSAALLAPTEPASAAAQTYSPTARTSATENRMATLLTSRWRDPSLGVDVSILVTDFSGKKSLWGKNSDRLLMPASTMKVLTAVTALDTLGPQRRLLTTAVLSTNGRMLTLRGGGDPSLYSSDVRTLAAAAAKAMRARGIRSVNATFDDSVFAPWSRPAFWAPDVIYTDVSPVRGLMVDGGRSPDSAARAGAVFCASLRANGVKATCGGRARVGSNGRSIAVHQSAPVLALVRHMLWRSDNDYAEALARTSARASGRPATFAGAVAAARASLRRLGAPIRSASIVDGSGLSRRNRLSARDLTAVLAVADRPSAGAVRLLRTGDLLPTAARSGSLSGRFSVAPASCAAGKVSAKTGTLTGVLSLAGYAKAADGSTRVFAIVVNDLPGGYGRVPPRRALDRIAATIVGCY